MPNSKWQCCCNCKFYDQRYHETGYCTQPDNSRAFRRGLMVYGHDGCDRYLDRASQVEESDAIEANRDAIAADAFEQMKNALGQ